MRLQKIFYGLPIAIAAAGGALFYGIHNSAENLRKELQTKDPERYESALENEPSRFFLGSNEDYWQHEVDKMNTAFMIDSVVKKAYFEGAQMVRDSIANANKE